jgi:peptide-methionine (R)-S-oxide reductase
MTRTRKGFLFLAAALCAGGALAQGAGHSAETIDWKKLTRAEWKKRLTANQFYILRQAGTEPAFRNPYHNNHEKGSYHCAGCNNLLFTSDTKFDSGTGWPSFWKPQNGKKSVTEHRDPDGQRVEVLCTRCDGHLGHVFDDATGEWGIPKTPTGLRYCMNSGAMKFVKAATQAQPAAGH